MQVQGEVHGRVHGEAHEGDHDGVHGMVADGFEPVREAFAANLAARGDRGAAVAVYRDGRPVVDLWGGLADARDGGSTDAGDPAEAADARAAGAAGAAPAAEVAGGTLAAGQPAGRRWTAGTAQTVRSVTKGVASAVPHLLHQRGQLDLDAPVSTYWPEFKQAGKERVLVRQLLAHRAGLPVLDTPLTPAQAIDGVSGPAALAVQAPAWEPGSAHGYHPTTYGWLLSELVLRVTGRSLRRWFAEEVADPLGLDVWLGVPVDRAHRVGGIADVPAPPPPASRGLRTRAKPQVRDAYRDPSSLTRRAFRTIHPAPDENDPAYRAAELAASGGIATARSLARFYAALIGAVDDPVVDPVHEPGNTTGDGAGGPGLGGPATASGSGTPRRRALFTPATLTQARSQESLGPDRVLVLETRFGLGYMLHHPASPMLGPGSFGHPGRGGSLAFADPESGTAFGYVTNSLHKSVTSDPRAQALVRALRSCLG